MTNSAPPTHQWQATEYPPRCPRCFYLLQGLSMSGTCPECGASFDAVSRLEYAHAGGFWRGVVRWTWPVLASLPVLSVGLLPNPFLGVYNFAQGIMAPALYGLTLATLVNAVYHAFRTLRRRRLRLVAVTSFVPSLGLYAQSFGCGAIVFVLSFVFVFGVSCAVIIASGSF